MKTHLETLSIKELETLALELYEKYGILKRAFNIHHKPSDISLLRHLDKSPPLNLVLAERRLKLNRTFKFTPATIARLLKINRLLADSLKKAMKEAAPIMLEMENRIKNKDPFLKDYELEIRLQPFFKNSKGIHALLEDITHASPAILNRDKREVKEYHAKSDHSLDHINWNQNPALLQKTFKRQHICHAMHELLNHSHWSFSDIIKITTVCTDLTVSHQHTTKIRHGIIS